mmetsp:Transcript_25347/g.47623  ORF Transcript_25347/g.47623 Transcript_25347/m.47623 type:complete len:357 (-) Transcript_25347:43-1113(-)
MSSNSFPNVYAHNLTSTEDLWNYVCGTEDLPEDVVLVPFCQFPYINDGWLTSGDGDAETFNDIKLNSCNVTFADAMGSAYSSKCILYGLLNLVFVIINCQYWYVIRARRLARKGKTMNLMEKLTMINLSVSFFHGLCCIDYNAYSGIYSYEVISVFKGYCAAAFILVAALLITSWVSIIDGGKSKKTPKWATNLTYFTAFYGVFSECVLGIIEIQMSEYKGGFDTDVNVFKNLSFALLCMIWAAVSIKYGWKISAQLKAGGGGAADKVIKRYLNAIQICMLLGLLYKFAFALLRFGKGYVYTFPPCGAQYFDIIGVLFLAIQTVISLVQNPNTAKAKKNQTKVGVSTVTSTQSSVD